MIWHIGSEAPKPRVGLILAGGGARAAYQVGVLKGIAKMLPKDAHNPFAILCGTSAGAINAVALAIYAERFRYAVLEILGVWKDFHVDQVFRADTLGILRSGLHWFAAMLAGGLGRFNPHSLLDRSPLEHMLRNFIQCERIQGSIDAGYLDAISITTSSYTSGRSMTFFQGKDPTITWERATRIGRYGEITLDHLMASSAIPFMFPAVKIGREYFGDGSMRQTAPISPAVHLGADRVLVIGVRHSVERENQLEADDEYPSLAQVAGHALNSIFLDNLEVDLERLSRINNTISLIPSRRLVSGNVTLRPIDVLFISPSENIGKIAEHYVHLMPRPMRFLLRGIGGYQHGSNLVSYLLFEAAFCRKLIQLGFEDTMARREEVLQFLEYEAPAKRSTA